MKIKTLVLGLIFFLASPSKAFLQETTATLPDKIRAAVAEIISNAKTCALN